MPNGCRQKVLATHRYRCRYGRFYSNWIIVAANDNLTHWVKLPECQRYQLQVASIQRNNGKVPG
jgi:hypothetical protein